MTEERIITKGDNQPPEALTLPVASEIDSLVKADVDSLIESIVLELDTVTRVPETIETDAIYQRVTTLATRLNGLETRRENAKKKHKDPYNKAGTAVENAFKLTYQQDGKERGLRKELETAITKLKGLLSAYDTKQYLAEQAQLDKETQDLAAAAAADGIEISGEAADVALTTTRSAHGGIAIKKLVKTYTISDESKIPISLMSPDPVKIQALIDGGAISIPGIEIHTEVNTHVQNR